VPQFNCYNVGPFYDGDEIVDDASLKFARFVQQDHRGEVTPCEGRIGGGCYRKTQVFECELRDSGQGETLPCFNFPHHDVICPIRPIGLKQTSDRTRTYNYGVNGIEPVRLKYTSTDEPEPLEPDTTLEWSGACSGDAYTRCGCQRKAGGSYSLRFGQSDRTLGLAAVASLPEPLAHLEYTDGTTVPSVTVTPEGQLDAPTATGGAVAMGLTLTWNQELRANSTVEVVVSPEVRDFFNGHQIGVAPEESTFETFDPNLMRWMRTSTCTCHGISMLLCPTRLPPSASTRLPARRSTAPSSSPTHRPSGWCPRKRCSRRRRIASRSEVAITFVRASTAMCCFAMT